MYLTIDIDGLDPSIVPTTGTPEPGGLGWYETLTLIRKLAEKKRVVGMDLVEYSYNEHYDSRRRSCARNWFTNHSLTYFATKRRKSLNGRIFCEPVGQANRIRHHTRCSAYPMSGIFSIRTFSENSQNVGRKLFYFALFTLVVVSGACKAKHARRRRTSPPATPTPAAPLVVGGVRTSYADIVDKTSSAVVRIEAEHKETQQNQPQMFPFGDDMFRQMPMPRQQMPNQRPQIERGLGSGVIVSADGTVLTNYHVVDGAEKITVLMSDNKSFEAKIVGSDQPSDLAVLKIDGQQLPF